ncbi:MAG: IS200/IS605 family transposase [Lentisphaeraceae bacterium]|nr:IS200/IS605 family transposase [Lentisphaeraceae bacterium]
MAGTFSKIYYHIAFSTKGRANFITKPIRDELYKYICGIIKNEQGFVYSIGGMEDHIHLLCSLPTTKSISEMMKRIKGHSSKWICSKSDTLSNFKWQAGFGLFTVSHSQIANVKQYIDSQHAHHQKMTFQDEFRFLLNKHNVDFEEQYIWK